jgi:hypothetical protein
MVDTSVQTVHFLLVFIMWGLASIISVTRPQAGQSEFCILMEARYFTLFLNIHTNSGAHATSN